jgi:hypothetical protein
VSIPTKAIDRLFERLTLTYGRQFLAQWDMLDDADLPRLKELWAYELAPFANRLDAVAWALENLPPRPPNIIEFKALCRNAPRPEKPVELPAPANPERVRAELAKLGHIIQQQPTGERGIEWAKAIVKRHRMGERINMTSLRFAKEALASRRVEA